MITTFKFNNNPISFNFGEDTTNMVNATEMLKAYPGRQMAKFLKSKSTQAYIEALKQTVPNGTVTDNEILIVQKDCAPNLRGTWMCEDLALYFAQWLDPVFHIWCNRKIKELLTTGQTTATDDERIHWFAKFPELKKKIKKGKRWKEPVKKVMEKMANSSARREDIEQFVNDILSGTKTDYKLDACRHLKDCTIETYEARGNDPIIDRITKDLFLEAINAYTQKLLKRRLTIESSKANKNDQLIVDLQSEISDLQHTLKGDKRPFKFNLKMDTLATDVDYVLNELPCTKYKKIFAGHLKENTKRVADNSPHYLGACDLLVTFKGKSIPAECYVNLWDYTTLGTVRVVSSIPTTKKPINKTLCAIDMFMSEENDEMLIGTDPSLEYHATFHKPSNYLIIYKNKL